MKNTYEFNIEEINEVRITNLTDTNKQGTMYSRKFYEDGTPMLEFVETHYATIDSTTHEGHHGYICRNCGEWNYLEISENAVIPEEYPFKCSHCSNDEEIVFTEEELIDLVLSFMSEDIDSFKDIEIYINDILIR